MKSIFFFLLLICFINCADKVKLDLYYESFCGGCKYMIIGEMNDLLSYDEMKDIVDLMLYPYGNGHIISRDPIKITCQHGDEECLGNKLEGCAIKHNEGIDNWYPFIYCMEYSGSKMIENDTVLSCAKENGLDGEDILKCAYSLEGDKIHLWNADHTPSDHEYVPWLLINDVLFEDGDLIQAVCDAYNGEKPSLCKSKVNHHNINVDKCSNNKNKKISNNQIINFEFYYESLCPDCEIVVMQDFPRIFLQNSGLEKIVNLTLVPYGNAKIVSRDPIEITCQHGDYECYGNQVEGCVIRNYEFETSLKFVYCLESKTWTSQKPFSDDNIRECSNLYNIDADKVLTCANGDEGKRIHLSMGDLTPTHSFVPWNIIDGELYTGDDIVGAICDKITGEKPIICNELKSGDEIIRKSHKCPNGNVIKRSNKFIKKSHLRHRNW